MTLDKDIGQQAILTQFFKYIRSEDFEQCVHWAKAELQSKNSSAYQIIQRLETQATVFPESLQHMNNDEVLLLFCACYCYARYEVEESNWYIHAETLVRSSITALKALPSCAFNNVLQQFACIQLDVCCIDRGIYTSQEWLLIQATEKINNHLENVSKLCAELNDSQAQLYEQFLAEEFNSYRYFSEGVSIIAQLCDIRWGDSEILANKMTQLRAKFTHAVNYLSRNNKYIMSSDLEALWPPLAYFSEHRAKNSGELFVDRGAVHISYFASVNHTVTRDLRESLSSIVNKPVITDKLFLEDWGAQKPQCNMLNDIWAGITKEFDDIYSWKLPSLSMPFRNKAGKDFSLCFSVELIYYPMGIFSLALKAQLDQVSASGVRHVMSLGTPFAMDQQMHCHGEDFYLLEEFADSRFTALETVLKGKFSHLQRACADILIFNKIENRYVTTVIDKVSECVDGQRTPITATSLKSHFAYPAFVLPQRELRSAIDDWCLRTAPNEDLNLNQDCYNHQEFVYSYRHECTLGLLQQPNWVIEQSAEMMNVAAAINNLFQLTNKLLGKQLSASVEQTNVTTADKKISAKELKAKIKTLTTEQASLKQFTHEAHWLLELINAGSMMTFPDHTRMIQKVFAQMDFEKHHTRTQDTLAKIQHRQEEIISESAKLYENIRTRNSKRFARILSGTIALISIGALKDIFDIINSSTLGIHISGPLQVSIVTIFGLMLILLLISKNDGDK